MKKRELLAKIEALQARIAALEARPVTYITPTVTKEVAQSPSLWPIGVPQITSGGVTSRPEPYGTVIAWN